MQIIQTITALRQQLNQWRQQGLKIAFVPTMGNLHAGHLKLVTEAKKHVDKVVVSIFVNPTQFGEGEDFESYPRTEQQDTQKLAEIATDILFMPAVTEIYPHKNLTVVSVTGISESHCGASRIGHFDGVATVVCKLFNIVQPDKAFFGEKDFQQLSVIRQMVSDLTLPIEIIAVKTQRETDGLAMSSRNGYLTASQRKIAPLLYQSLCQASEQLHQGKYTIQAIEQQHTQFLNEQGFKVDYFSICRVDNLQPVSALDKECIILAAARLGKPRLIDNTVVSL